MSKSGWSCESLVAGTDLLGYNARGQQDRNMDLDGMIEDLWL